MSADIETIKFLWPEIFLVTFAALIFVFGAIIQPRGRFAVFAGLSLLVAGFATYRQMVYSDFTQVWTLDGPLLIDYLGHLVRCLMYGVGLLLVCMAMRAEARELTGEVYGSLLLVVAGTMLASQAGSLVLLFLALELISIPTYVLLFLGRRTMATAEATTKYFFLSILSSALLLYGFSFLYGMAGSTSLMKIHGTLAAGALNPEAVSYQALAPIAFLLILAGLGFKIAMVPFHFYAADVYQGTTNLNAGLLAVVPKLAGVIALTRLLLVMSPALGAWGWQTILILSMATMTLGNVSALWQTNVRRLMAYSSIAHAGYMLIGLVVALAVDNAAAQQAGIAAMLLYLAVYVFASLGTFAAFTWLSDDDQELDQLSQLVGIGVRRPATAICLSIFMFSLAGIPPLAGFWGKLMLFWEAIGSGLTIAASDMAYWFIVLAVVGVVNAAIGAAYYLRLIATMFFPTDESSVATVRQGVVGAAVAMVVCAAFIVGTGVFPGRMITATVSAAQAAWSSQESDELLVQIDTNVLPAADSRREP